MNSTSILVSRCLKFAGFITVLFLALIYSQTPVFAAQTITGTTINATTLNATTISGTYSGTLGAANVSAGIFGSNTGNGTFVFPAGIQGNAYNNTGYFAMNNAGTYWGIMGNYGVNDWRIGYGNPLGLTGWNLRWDAGGNVWANSSINSPTYNISGGTQLMLGSPAAQNLEVKAGGAGSLGITGYDSNNTWMFQLYGVGSSYGFLNGNWAGWDIQKSVGGAMILNGSQTVLTSANYNSYSPTLTGGGASGNWGINANGLYGSPNISVGTLYASGAISGPGYASMPLVAGGGNSWYGMGTSDSSGGATAVGGYYPYAINNHTGLAFSAHSSYGGIRFYNQNYPTAPMTATPVMTITSGNVYIGSGSNLYLYGSSSYGFSGYSAYFDTVNTGSSGDPLEINYAIAGDMRMYNGDFTMQDNRYIYPGSITAGYSFQKSWYLASSPSWGLYTNTSMYFAGGGYAPNLFQATDNGSGYLRICTYGCLSGYSASASYPVLKTNGAYLYFDVAGTYTGYLTANYPYFRAYYDYDNGAYYVDPASTSNIYDLKVNGTLNVYGTALIVTNSVLAHDFYSANASTLKYVYSDLVCGSTGGCTYFTNLQTGAFMASSYNYASDISLKKNIKTIPNALNDILKLRGVKFNWKEDGRVDIGLVAQEVEKVYPEIVSTNPSNGLKSVEYGNLVGPLIEATKELKQEIDSQKKINDEQQKLIEQLQEEIKRIKNK